jgi:hypothetical protein
MKNSKDKIIQSLSKLLPESISTEVIPALESYMDQFEESVRQEYDQKLEEAYNELSEEKSKIEKVAETGYSEAYSIICDLRDRLEIEREEFKNTLEEGYEEAYQMLLSERRKNENLEVETYDEYEKKLEDIKNHIVDKVDHFLSFKSEEFYEQAKKDVLNDPMVAEHKCALDKILEVASNFLTNDDHLLATNSKLEDLKRQVDEISGQKRILEAKNIRLSTENVKLNEAVRHQKEMLTESVRLEQKERVKKARNVEGRGQKEVKLIAEFNENRNSSKDEDSRLVESSQTEIVQQWKHLANINESK